MTDPDRAPAPVFPPKPDALCEIFGVGREHRVLIGVLHLKPLPGAPRYEGEALRSIIDAASRDAERYLENGMDGLIVENGWDLPFAKPDAIGHETVASLTAVAQSVANAFGAPIGINCLANAACASLAVAKAVGARFVRVNQWVNAYVANEGIVEGAAAVAMRYRSAIHAREVRIFADVHVKHGSHAMVADRSLAEQTRDAVWFDADVLIATGNRTGDATPLDEIRGVRAHTELPVIVGSGMTADHAKEALDVARGAIVGTSLKRDGLWWNPVDAERVRAFVTAARSQA